MDEHLQCSLYIYAKAFTALTYPCVKLCLLLNEGPKYTFLRQLILYAFNYVMVLMNTLVYGVGTKTIVLRMSWHF